jgi:ribosome maturation factor RimP
MGFLDEPKTDQLRQIAEAVVKDNFLELFDLVVRPQGKKLHVTVVLDKKSGLVTLDECTMVSREFEKRLDELDLIGPAYLLEVSSPGMDRPLRNLNDCRRFQGKLAQFVFHQPVEGLSTFRGRLGEVKDDKVELTEGSRTLWAPFGAVKRANLVVEL